MSNVQIRNVRIERKGKNKMENVRVILKKGEGRTLKAGGMWVYDNEIDHIEGDFIEGISSLISTRGK